MAKKAIAEARIVQAYIDKSSKWKDNTQWRTMGGLSSVL
jgi:hypothetical protein